MKPLLPIFIWLWSCLAKAQAKEVSSYQKKNTAKTTFAKDFQNIRVIPYIKPETQPPGL
jgi:hypothetical protein